MKQQINLYQPIFRKQKIIFSAQTMASMALGFLMLLLLWSFLIDQRVARLEVEYDRQLAAEQRAIGQLTDLQQSMPPAEPSPELERRVEQFEQTRESLIDSLEALDQRLPAAEAALSESLAALARRVPDGLWLTGIELGQDQRLTLNGRALSARLVPVYLDALADEPLVSGTGFRRVQVRASEDGVPGVKFNLSTTAADQP